MEDGRRGRATRHSLRPVVFRWDDGQADTAPYRTYNREFREASCRRPRDSRECTTSGRMCSLPGRIGVEFRRAGLDQARWDGRGHRLRFGTVLPRSNGFRGCNTADWYRMSLGEHRLTRRCLASRRCPQSHRCLRCYPCLPCHPCLPPRHRRRSWGAGARERL
jgi:hypothetical protein